MPSKLSSFQSRLFWAFALITLVAALLPALFFRQTLYSDRITQAENQALAEATFLKGLAQVGLDDQEWQELLASSRMLSRRLTVIGPEGRVLYDSHFASQAVPELDNHLDRPEFEAAARSGQGTSLRRSTSLDVEAVYAAVALERGGYVRIAVPLADIRYSYEAELGVLSLVIGAIVLFCLLFSALMAKWIRSGISTMVQTVESVSLGGGTRRMLDVPGKEFLPLAQAVNRMADDIADYTRTTSEQQAQLEIILDSIHEGVLVFDPAGTIRRYNRALAFMFPHIEQASGKQLIELVPVPALQRAMESLLSSEVEEGGEGQTLHVEYPAGRFLVAHLSKPVQAHESLGAVMVFYDATELTRLERVRRDFVSNVSHELRTPLTAITGYAETLMGLEEMEEQPRNFARIIHKHATMLGEMISDLLELARIENTRSSVDVTAVMPDRALEQALDLCRKNLEQKGLTVAANLPDQAILANLPLLTRIFRNLLENAIRYSPEGESIRVEGHVEDKMMHFMIMDCGPGIPEEELERIFERFYQVEKQRTNATAGIGLAICKHAVEGQGGRIWAQSPGTEAATVFHFILPLASPEARTTSFSS